MVGAMARLAVLLLVAGSVAAPRPLPAFRSPSGNIRCFLTPAPVTLFCSLRHAAYADALQARCSAPSGPGVDWHGFELTAARRGAVSCSGGIIYPGRYRPAYVALGYGRTWRRGAFTCASARSGVTCRTARGHGIFVSRESWRVW
jgi:hypothetical protein